MVYAIRTDVQSGLWNAQQMLLVQQQVNMRMCIGMSCQACSMKAATSKAYNTGRLDIQVTHGKRMNIGTVQQHEEHCSASHQAI